MAALNLRAFGGLSIENGDPYAVEAIQPAGLAILVVLAAAGDVGISRDRLLALFWPESDSERARGSLRQALYRLRRDTGRDDLVLGSTVLRLNSDAIASDVAEFRRATGAGELESAVQQYAAPFLDGFYLREAPEFERWVERERGELAAMQRRALEHLAVAAAARGDFVTAAELWRRLASIEPSSGRITLALMEALVAAGDREAALRHATAYSKLVRSELDVEPDPTVLARASDLRRQTGTVARPKSSSETAPHSLDATAEIGTSLALTASTTDIGYPSASIPDASSGHRTRWTLALSGLALGLVALAGIVWHRENRVGTVSPLVAVAPIENRTGDTSLDRAARLASQQLAGALAQSGRIDVADLARLASPRPGTDGDRASMEAARSIGADRVVSTSMYRQGDSLHLEAQIVATSDGRIVHQIDPVIGSSRDLMEIIHELRDRVGGAVLALADTLYRPWSEAHSRPPTYAAFQEFIQALDGIATEDARAADHLRAAVSLDTSFVEAKLWLIRVAETRGNAGALLATRDTRRSAYGDSLLKSAIAERDHLAPFDAAALDYVAAARAQDWERAYQVAGRLQVLAPKTQDAMHFFADAAKNTRRYSQAIPVIHDLLRSTGWMHAQAIWLDWDLLVHHMAGDHEGALAHWRELRQRYPDNSRYCVEGLRHFAAMNDEPRVDSLIAVCARMQGGPTPSITYVGVAEHYLAWGHPESARRVAEFTLPALAALADTGSPTMRRQAARNRGRLLCMLSEWDRCYDVLKSQAGDSLSLVARLELGVAAAHVGDARTVDQVLSAIDREAAEPSPPNPPFVYPEYRAAIALARGERAAALRLLEQAQREGDIAPHNRWQTNWMFLPLRGNPTFEAFLTPVR